MYICDVCHVMCPVRDAVCLDAQKGVMRPGQTLVEHSSPEICLSTHCSHALDPNTGYYALTTTSTNCAARCNQVRERILT